MDLKIPEILSSQQQAVEFKQVQSLCCTFHARCMRCISPNHSFTIAAVL